MKQQIFKYSHTKGNIDYYTVSEDFEIEIPAIDPKSGSIEYKKITQYTIHRNLEMYKISDSKKRFKEFWASSDHSLIVRNKKRNTIEKIKPISIKEAPEKYNLIRLLDTETLETEEIPCTEISIEYDPSKIEAADFTVEDYYTFCTADGVFVQDTLALYTPITAEAQREVKEKMIGSYVNTGSGTLGYTPSQDVVLGIYELTKSAKPESYVKAQVSDITKLPKTFDYNFDTPVHYKGARGEGTTSYGRYLLTMVFPRRVAPALITYPVKKKELTKLLEKGYKVLSKEQFANLLTIVTELAGKALLVEPVTPTIDELIVPKDIKDLVKKVFKENDLVTATYQMQKIVIPKLKSYLKKVNSGLYELVESGAKGSWADIEQILLAKGYVADNTGKILKDPIMRSFIEGLLPSDVQKMGPAVIKGSADRSLNTQKTGALLRILSFALSTIKLDRIDDCKTKNTLDIKIEDEDIAKGLRYRYSQGGDFTGYITDENYKDLVGKRIKLRTPIYCKSKGICKKCYGLTYNVLKSEQIGTLAAMSLGERGSQLMMKTFHLSKVNVKNPVNINQLWGTEILLNQSKDMIYALKDITLVLDASECKFTYVEDTITITSGILVVKDSDQNQYKCDFGESQIPFGIEIQVEDPEKINLTDIGLEIEFSAKEFVGTIQYITEDMSTQIKQLQSYLYGNVDTIEDLFRKLQRMYAPLGILSVHYELLISNMARRAKNLFHLYRHYHDEPYKLLSIKTVPFYESPLVGIGFENIEKASELAIIATQEGITYKDSPVEKLLLATVETDIKITDILK